MLKKFINGIKNDPVYFLGITISSMALVMAILLAMANPLLVLKLVLPMAKTIFSTDNVLQPNTLNMLKSFLNTMPLIFLLTGLFTLCYAFIWRYFSLRLPAYECNTQHRSLKSISPYEIYCLLIAMFIALILGLRGITRGLTFDEIWSAQFFVNATSLWKTISFDQCCNNHVAYSILARFSQTIFGQHEWALRLPALLLGLGSLYYLWIFGRSIVQPKLAVAAIFCLALSPSHVTWSKSARGYSGMVLLTLISTNLFFKLLYHPTRNNGFKFVLASVIGMYFHAYAVFVTLTQILFLLYCAGCQMSTNYSDNFLHVEAFHTLWLSFPTIGGLFLILTSPLFASRILGILKAGRGTFQLFFPLKLIEMLSGGSMWLPLRIIVPFLFILGLISLRASSSKEMVYFVLLFLFPLCTAWFSSPYWFYTRFFLFYLPYYILLSIVGFWTLWNFRIRQWRVVKYLQRALYCVIALSILCAWGINVSGKIYEGGFRDAVRAMEMGINESIALCAIGNAGPFFQYYSKRKIFVPQTMEEFRKIDKEYPEIRCACRSTYTRDENIELFGDTIQQRKIANFLLQHAHVQKFGRITVFIYKKSE